MVPMLLADISASSGASAASAANVHRGRDKRGKLLESTPTTPGATFGNENSSRVPITALGDDVRGINPPTNSESDAEVASVTSECNWFCPHAAGEQASKIRVRVTSAVTNRIGSSVCSKYYSNPHAVRKRAVSRAVIDSTPGENTNSQCDTLFAPLP